MLIPQAAFFNRCFGAQICVFHEFHTRTSLKRMYGAPRMFCAKVERKLSIPSKPIRFLKNWQVFPKNMSCNMKMCVSSVSLFKICASIIYNLRKHARRALYFRQRFHLFTQYVLCRYGRYRFSERCFCTKICDFQ